MGYMTYIIQYISVAEPSSLHKCCILQYAPII